jgi:putative protein kinase ArgK-like GTPase of G3E family
MPKKWRRGVKNILQLVMTFQRNESGKSVQLLKNTTMEMRNLIKVNLLICG